MSDGEQEQESCADTFATIGPDDFEGDRAAYVDERHCLCQCEACSVSRFSPGPVASEELLIRLVIAPQHVNRKKLPKAGVLSDAERNGLSMLRATATDAEIVQSATGLVQRARERNGPTAGVFGVLHLRCETIRSFCMETEVTPCYCVYDTALEASLSHAEAFQQTFGINVDVRDQRRRQLFELVSSTFEPVATFRGGLLQNWAATV